MKKFTILTSLEYESFILEAIGRTGVVHLKEVTGPYFERLKVVAEKKVDYGDLSDRFHASYRSIIETETFEQLEFKPSRHELWEFIEDPEEKVNELIVKLEEGKKRLEEARGRIEDANARLVEERARLESVRTLKPDELKRCLVVGVVQLKLLPRLEEHLQRFEDITYRTIEISNEEGFFFVFGPEKRRDFVEAIFVVLDVKDIFDVLTVRDILLALDIKKREDVLKEYEKTFKNLEMFIESEEEIKQIKHDLTPTLSEAAFIDSILRTISDEEIPVLRTKTISVIQGWVPTESVSLLKKAIGEVEEKIGEQFFFQYEDPSHEEEEEVPTKRPTIRPKFFDPAFTLTSLRGWPTAHEVNPTIVTLLIFSLQFGVMFGDVGQGLIFLILGLILSRKFKSGLASKLGVAFIPMGIMCIVFGFLYGEVFLVSGIIHPLLLSPVEQIMKLFQIVLGIAVLEMSVGLALGAINQYKEGNIAGVIGEHGAGGILFFVGLYFMATEFYIARDFMAIMGHWSFIMLMIGLVMTFVEPILSAVVLHKEIGFEVVGEGMAAFLITFIEGLCNFFSFLRIAAFALAHGMLAVAAHALVGVMGVGGIVLMNIIAMTFEFVSSSVQSLRLLYYEFMGKFFHGTGIPYKPFRVRKK